MGRDNAPSSPHLPVSPMERILSASGHLVATDLPVPPVPTVSINILRAREQRENEQKGLSSEQLCCIITSRRKQKVSVKLLCRFDPYFFIL
jgi:hypothetical protein